MGLAKLSDWKRFGNIANLLQVAKHVCPKGEKDPLVVLVGLPTRAGLREARISLPLIRAEVVAALLPLLV